MMSLLIITILLIFGVVTSQNHDANLQTPYSGLTRRKSMEALTAIPANLTVQHEGTRLFLTRLETLEYLITNTTRIFQSLENQLSQSSSCPASPVVQKIENLEAKVENLGKNLQELMDVTRNLSSDVEAIKRNVSSLINVTSTRPLVDLSSNSELKQIFNEGLQEVKDLRTLISTSYPLNIILEKQHPRNCREVRESGTTASGVSLIQPESASKPFLVVCDLETQGGGWTVIQKRFDGSQDFYRNWQDYKYGFGNLGGEFWLGLENIHLLTGFEVNELLIELGDFESQNKSASYSEFSVGSEMEGYSLKVLGAYSGDAGDSLIDQAGMKFSTKDKDQDFHTLNCAEYYNGAWWYHTCGQCNLNGKYSSVPEINIKSVFWYNLKNNVNSLKRTRMLVRPKVYSMNLVG